MRDSRKEGLGEEMRRLRSLMVAILKKNGVDKEDWEDLIQDTLLEALRQWERIESLEGWCAVVLRNRAWDRNRRRRREPIALGGWEDLAELAIEQESPQVLRDSWRDVEKVAREVLSVRARRLLATRYLEGQITAESARRPGR